MVLFPLLVRPTNLSLLSFQPFPNLETRVEPDCTTVGVRFVRTPPFFTEASPYSLLGTLNALVQLRDSELLKYCSANLGGDLERAVELLTAISSNNRYTVGANVSGFLKECLELATGFARFTVGDKGLKAHLPGTVLKGKDALAARYQFISDAMDDGGRVSFRDLNPLHVFSYTFSETEAASIRDWTVKTWTMGGSPSDPQKSATKIVRETEQEDEFEDELRRLAE